MLQWVGSGLLLIGGAGLGFYYSEAFSRRLKLLKSLHQTMNLLKGEIAYGSLPLPDAFLRIAKRIPSPLADFLGSLGRKLKCQPGEPFSQLFAAEVHATLSGVGLAKEDLEQLNDLGRHLGYLDLQTQLRTLDLYTHSLEDTIWELKKELPGRKKVSQSLGIMGGLLLAIVLL